MVLACPSAEYILRPCGGSRGFPEGHKYAQARLPFRLRPEAVE